MGAFGEYLQARLGGTKHDVSTWDKSRSKVKEKSKKQIEEENDEDDSDLFEQIVGHCTHMVKQYKYMKDNLINNDEYLTLFKTDSKLEEFEKWRKEFIKTL